MHKYSHLVHNKYRKTAPPGAIYIGRPSCWGNPFILGQDGTREEVIQKYREWIQTQPELMARARKVLRAQHLLCYCAPQPCHGHVLAEIANDSI